MTVLEFEIAEREAAEEADRRMSLVGVAALAMCLLVAVVAYVWM
ncbi:MAG TPA: hypothetical protein VK504_18760 [Vicinamibacterales bacterium]|nr:hypothetical protein [Vicinamibacterales bacterium]